MEEKVKPEIMHLMILSKCDHSCELCCNKLYDTEKIPVASVEELKTVHTLCITGGEPFESFVDLNVFAANIRKQYQNIKHIYVYTSGGKSFVSNIPTYGFGCFDGVNFAPKNIYDWGFLYAFARFADKEILNSLKNRPNNRLYVFKEQVEVFENVYKHLADKLNLNVIYRTWDKEFKTPDNEIFRRLPIFLG